MAALTEDEKVKLLMSQRRFQVFVDYPFSPFSVGEIFDTRNREITRSCILEKTGNYKNLDESFFLKYPDVFAVLEWWQEREGEELTGYIKTLDTDSRTIVYRIRTSPYSDCTGEENGVFFEIKLKERWSIPDMNEFIPATKKEYLQYKRKNQKLEQKLSKESGKDRSLEGLFDLYEKNKVSRKCRKKKSKLREIEDYH
jgi:hypothetical protein